MCLDLVKEFRRPVVFAGQLVFQRENLFTRTLHHETAFSIQRRPAVRRRPGHHPADPRMGAAARGVTTTVRGAESGGSDDRNGARRLTNSRRTFMYPIDLSGTHALVMGVANHRSLSWAIAQHLAPRRRRAVPHLSGRAPQVDGRGAGRHRRRRADPRVRRDDATTTIDAVRARLEAEWGRSRR